MILRCFAVAFCVAQAVMAVSAQDDDITSANNAAYRDFDFVAGTKTLFYDDFSTDLLKWKVIEHDKADDVEPPGVRTLDGNEGMWFKLPRRGLFYPLNIKALPQAFTIEFDMWADSDKMSEMESGLILSIVSNKVKKDEYSFVFDANPQIQLDVHPSAELLYCQATKENYDGERLLDRKDVRHGWMPGKVHRISISRQASHVKLYVDHKKFLDLPNGLPINTTYTLLLATSLWGDGLFVSNVKVAEIVSPPKSATHIFTTNAIYFRPNSAVIKPESWPALRSAATLINATQKNITILGHTDSDGSEADNLRLSKQRAESVKAFLVQNFGINESRLIAEGMGEAQPIDNNATAEGKANNRRVEFISR